VKVEISNIRIKVNKKQLTLTLSESKLLFEKLNEIFGLKYNYIYPFTTIPITTPLITWSDNKTTVENVPGLNTLTVNDRDLFNNNTLNQINLGE